MKTATWKPALFLLLGMGISTMAQATTLGVPSAKYPTIQAAVNAAASGDTILLTGAFYTGNGNWNIVIPSNKVLTIISSGGPDNCVIDLNNPQNHVGAFSISNDSHIEGITIQNGLQFPCISVQNANPAIVNCHFDNNLIYYGLGALYYVSATSGQANVSNCTFTGNTGGGLYLISQSSAKVSDCTFLNTVNGSGLEASATSGASLTISHCIANSNGGDGLFVDGDGTITACTCDYNIGSGLRISGNLTVSQCTCVSNGGAGMATSANFQMTDPTISDCVCTSNFGSGMFIGGGSPQISHCAFTFNGCASSNSQSGGGMALYQASPTISDCRFMNNIGNQCGGISVLSQSNLFMTRCVVSANICGPVLLIANGGGIACDDSSSLTLYNCVISGNGIQGNGGGIYSANGEKMTLTNCTVVNNDAFTGNGGGIYALSSSGISNALLTNCIVWGNTASSDPGIPSQFAPAPTVTYSDVQGGFAGTGNIAADPLFVNAGSTYSTDGDFHLPATSPCVNAGSAAALPPSEMTDLDGNPRISGSAPDMGAYELQAIAGNGQVHVAGSITLQDVVNAAQPLTLEFRPTDGSAAFTRTVTLATDGSFSLANIPAKPYHLAIKGSKWLQRVVAIDASNGDLGNVNVSLLAGDADNNNVVDFDDLTILAIAYNTAVGDALYDDRADFNCDGQVEFADLTLLAINYNLAGDP